MSRSVYNGWNTLCVPFSMTTEELNAAFGAGCKLETLSAITKEGDVIDLYFTDVKAEGVKANTPYLLHYTGETKTVKMLANETTIEANDAPSLLFVADNAFLQFNGAAKHIEANEQDAMYGIYVKDNAEAAFTLVTPETTGFYATRCYVQLGSDNNRKITTNHLGAGEVSSIQMVANSSETVDVYNLSGVKVARNLRASEVNKLNPGIYVVKGQKITVK